MPTGKAKPSDDILLVAASIPIPTLNDDQVI